MAVLSYLNLVLLSCQLAFTYLGVLSFQKNVIVDNKTLLTPSASTFDVAVLVHVLLISTIIVDCVWPSLSFFKDADQPNMLRIAFGASCAVNIFWRVLAQHDFVALGALHMSILWLILSLLYLFVVSKAVKFASPEFDWRRRIFSELGIRLYFAWASVLTVVSWATAIQLYDDWMSKNTETISVPTYLLLLGAIVVMALCAISFAEDPVLGMVVAWMLLDIASSPTVDTDKEKQAKVQACAAFASGIIMVLLIAGITSACVKRLLSPPVKAKPQRLSTVEMQDYGALTCSV